jgi:hypothetical protein
LPDGEYKGKALDLVDSSNGKADGRTGCQQGFGEATKGSLGKATPHRDKVTSRTNRPYVDHFFGAQASADVARALTVTPPPASWKKPDIQHRAFHAHKA